MLVVVEVVLQMVAHTLVALPVLVEQEVVVMVRKVLILHKMVL